MIEITDEELRAMNKAIFVRYKIDFTQYAMPSFKRVVTGAMYAFKMDTLFELWRAILADKEFMLKFIDQITVGMTSMFRFPRLWFRLKNDILPNHFQHSYNISIMHAGCSTGEEIYTMGIVLQEAKMQFKAKAIAVDLNRKSIAFAKAGVFHNATMEQNRKQNLEYSPSSRLDKYYTIQEDKYIMNADLRKHVDFRVQNIVSEPIQEKFDIIFCRNVMIYFDEDLKAKIIQKFYHALNPRGFLIIGGLDFNNFITKDQFEFYSPSERIYRKI